MKNKITFTILVPVLSLFALETSARSPRQQGLYSVPVPTELAQFAEHEIEIQWKNQTPGARVIQYDLPDELEGVGQDILLTEGELNKFSGPKADAVCTHVENLQCEIQYKNLEKSPTRAAELINQRYTDPTEISARQQITAAFVSDPISRGILKSSGPISKRRR
jgi:hypothetical protein